MIPASPDSRPSPEPARRGAGIYARLALAGVCEALAYFSFLLVVASFSLPFTYLISGDTAGKGPLVIGAWLFATPFYTMLGCGLYALRGGLRGETPALAKPEDFPAEDEDGDSDNPRVFPR